ncbi:hypothetical protein VTI74DRAFT_558 [Chaetomium olivicolor]
MDNEPADDNLLLALNLSDSEPEEAAAPASNITATSSASGGPTSEYQPTRAERTALSEEAFQCLKQTYRPKVENGNIHQTITLPIPLSSTPLPKPEAQELLHAVEELYFFRKYAEAVQFLEKVFESEGSARIDGETGRLLRVYRERCIAQLERAGSDR